MSINIERRKSRNIDRAELIGMIAALRAVLYEAKANAQSSESTSSLGPEYYEKLDDATTFDVVEYVIPIKV